MPDTQAQTPGQRAIGDFAQKLVTLTDDVLFGDVWERPELSKRDRSLVTVAAVVTNGSTEQLKSHLVRAKDNGPTEAELQEAVIHLAFYAGWPRAMSAITVAKEIFGARPSTSGAGTHQCPGSSDNSRFDRREPSQDDSRGVRSEI